MVKRSRRVSSLCEPGEVLAHLDTILQHRQSGKAAPGRSRSRVRRPGTQACELASFTAKLIISRGGHDIPSVAGIPGQLQQDDVLGRPADLYIGWPSPEPELLGVRPLSDVPGLVRVIERCLAFA